MEFSASEIEAGRVMPDGARIELLMRNGAGEALTLRLPVDVVPNLIAYAADLGGSAQREGYHLQQPILAETLVFQKTNDPAYEWLTIVLTGGLNIVFQIPADQVGDA